MLTVGLFSVFSKYQFLSIRSGGYESTGKMYLETLCEHKYVMNPLLRFVLLSSLWNWHREDRCCFSRTPKIPGHGEMQDCAPGHLVSDGRVIPILWKLLLTHGYGARARHGASQGPGSPMSEAGFGGLPPTSLTSYFLVASSVPTCSRLGQQTPALYHFSQ